MFFVREFLFSPVIIIPSMPHTCIHLRVALFGRTNGRSLGTLQKVMLFRKSGNVEQKITSIFSSPNYLCFSTLGDDTVLFDYDSGTYITFAVIHSL
jgi:hypothetical protein